MKKIATIIFCIYLTSLGSNAQIVKNQLPLNVLKIDSTINYNPCSRTELLVEIDEKLNRVMSFLDEQNLGGILLSTTRNFAWITAGIGDSHIVLASETGPASLLILRNGKRYLVGDNAEIPHLMDENLNGLGYEPLQYMWNENKKLEFVSNVAQGKLIGSDIPLDGLMYVEPQFATLRYQFTPSEVKKIRWLSNNTAEAVAEVCRTIQPGMSDKYIEMLTSDALLKRGIRPTVLLIGVDDRISKYCHFPPVGKELEKYAFVNVCAQKWGMITSVGRYVYFGELPEKLRVAVYASASICAKMIHYTRPGTTAGQMFNKFVQWYAEEGYPNEWKKIHSGGGIGYSEREWLATGPGSKQVFKTNQAFAWNPFVSATLSFHTIICQEDMNEIVTQIKGWPIIPIEIEGKIYDMPDILVREKP